MPFFVLTQPNTRYPKALFRFSHQGPSDGSRSKPSTGARHGHRSSAPFGGAANGASDAGRTGRLRHWRGPRRPERAEHVSCKTFPRLGSVALCGVYHPGVGHQYQDEILQYEVGAQRSRGPSALDNVAQPDGGGTKLPIELGGGREREREHIRAPRTGGLHGARGAGRTR